ncbi:MAG: hypothetical protein JSR77_05375 [Planctomycetes bacterium]|nr:hypothetical protein [Planctomycetota bacterium]
MSTIRPIILTLGGLAAAWTLAGCGSPPGVIFDPANTSHRWPSPPDEPRIAYVGEIRTDADLKAGKGFGAAFHDFLVGEDPPRAMVSPMGVCRDGGDRLFVADPGVQGVHVFDLAKRTYQVWRPPKGSPTFASPVAVAFDSSRPSGRVLVADSLAAAVFVFDQSGKFTGLLGEGELRRPAGLVVEAASGRIMVADAASHQIVVLSAEGAVERRVGERGAGLGQFNFPTNLTFDSRGHLFVSDSLNFRVQMLSADLRPISQFGTKGDLPGYFSQPKGVTVDRLDHLYVVDANFEAVQLFDLDGRLLMSFGREGRGPGEFWLPAGICADAGGRIWIADSYNSRVQVFQFIGPGATP